MKCPACGANAEGKFCAECGSPLVTSRCASCQAKLAPGARFCTQCGTAVKGARGASNLGWYLGAVAIVGAIVILLLPTLRPETSSPSGARAAPPSAEPAGGTGTPPPLSSNMRENADRLFNRVMQANEAGDTAQVKQFAPMAIMAYQNSGQLDADGLYHLSVLQMAAGDAAAARATADQLLADNPTHLLGLSAAATAARSQNDLTAARGYYQRLVDSFAAERAKALPEYQDHQNLLPGMQTDAVEFLKR